jgi:hypothetical protein
MTLQYTAAPHRKGQLHDLGRQLIKKNCWLLFLIADTTLAGCTIGGILEPEEGGLRVNPIRAVMRTTQRAKELAG